MYNIAIESTTEAHTYLDMEFFSVMILNSTGVFL